MPLLQATAKRSLEMLQLESGECVLDVGCGSGVFLHVLAQEVGPTGRVVGVDHAHAMVEQARVRMARWTNVIVEPADAYRLPYAENTFDSAHCERVLMHLDEPRSTILEMRRVTKPGGRIVAAEPDWGGLQIPTADPTAVRLLLASWLGELAQPRMGLELHGKFVDAGLTEVTTTPVVLGVTDYQELVSYGLDLDRIAISLHDEHLLDQSRANAVLEDWSRASAEGRFFAYIGMFVTCGRVPECALPN